MNLKIIGHFYYLLLKSKAEYRLNFFLEIFVNMFTYIISYCGIWIILRQFGSINGWNYYEVSFLYTLNLLTYGIACLFFYIPIRSIEKMVQSGEFDIFFVKPLDPFWHLIMRQSYLGFLSHVVLGFIMLVFCLNKLAIGVSLHLILVLALIVLGGSLIQSAIIIFFGSLSIKYVRTNNLMDIFIYQIRGFIEYPVSIYPIPIQLFITFIVPYAFVNYYPSVYLTGRVSGITGFLFVISPAVIGVLLFWLAYRFFHKMLEEYTGAGA